MTTTDTPKPRARRTTTTKPEDAKPDEPVEETEPVEEREPEPPAENVIVALARVMRDLPGISKGMQAAPDQGGYSYRGIEQITAVAQKLLAREQIVPTPKVLSWERDIVHVGSSNNRKEWHDERMMIEYTFVHGPSMTTHVVGPLPAIGRDGTDKGTNKCLTQAFKYTLIQSLCIGDPADDADGKTHEAEPRDTPPPLPDPENDPITPDQVKQIRSLVKELRDRDVDDAATTTEAGLTIVLGVTILERDEESGATRPRASVAQGDDIISQLDLRVRRIDADREAAGEVEQPTLESASQP